MKRFLIGVLKFLGSLVVSFFIFLFLGSWALSYLAIDQLTQLDSSLPAADLHGDAKSAKTAFRVSEDPDEQVGESPAKARANLPAMKSLGQELLVVIKNLDVVEDIKKAELALLKGRALPICDVLCAPLSFNPGEGLSSNRPLDNLKEFYLKNGKRAFEDPAYRMTLEMFLAGFSLFSPSLQHLISEFAQELSKTQGLSTSQKIKFATRAQLLLIQDLPSLKGHVEAGYTRMQRMQELLQLRPSCQQIERVKLLRQCRDIQTRTYGPPW